ncbi:Com family DNA-binding transcriptional regulator [Acidovorax sp. HMWF029]|uniref:Com family DNA-binding transcriptional regulator n=1 Tax=Acidovorax sp. HMWF029 TaxID=2056863 RepID=UPI001E553606|nr:Com family DNA-binding transcriptional regulator [Acidovorax sp. HMWF029]
MQEVRCGRCQKLLARADGIVEIKCPRCGCLNHWRASPADRSGQSPQPERHERHKAMCNDDAKKPFGMAGRQEPLGRPDHREDAGSPDLLRGVRGRGLGAL